MKKIILIAWVLAILLPLISSAEDYSSLSLEELQQKKVELQSELKVIDALIAKIRRGNNFSDTEENLGSIESLFPDEQLAMFVRDKLGKFSINELVSQAELDTITEASFSQYFGSDYFPADLTGISHLRNLTNLNLTDREDITFIPDEICSLIKLKSLSLQGINIQSLPEDIGDLSLLEDLYLMYTPITELPDSFSNLSSLQFLTLSYTKLKELPDSICQLTSLKELYLDNTEISKLPDNIGNLVNLETLDISNTKIDFLPSSIYELKIKNLNMQGTGIK